VGSETVGFYEERILPRLIHLSMRQTRLAPYRGRVVSTATGRVLEIGIGSGLNVPFYGLNVNQVVGLEPSQKLLEMALNTASHAQIRWSSSVCRTWARTGGGRALVAGPPHTRMEVHLWRLPSKPRIEELIEKAGLRIERLEKSYMRGPKPLTFMYEGSARPQ
jgi:hypothetical protein